MESIGKDHGGHADTAEITERINIGNAAARFRGGPSHALAPYNGNGVKDIQSKV